MTDQTAHPCNAAVMHRLGSMATAHGPHQWTVQPGMEPVHCPGTEPPAADQTERRDRYAKALHRCGVQLDDAGSLADLDDPQQVAVLTDAVMAVADAEQAELQAELRWTRQLAQTNCERVTEVALRPHPAAAPAVDRAAVLREAADAIDAETRKAKADGVLEPDKYRPCRDASAQLRAMACPTPLTHNWGCGCPTDETPAAGARQDGATP